MISKSFPASDITVIEKYLTETYGVTRATARKHVKAAYESTLLSSRKFIISYLDGKNGNPDIIVVTSR